MVIDFAAFLIHVRSWRHMTKYKEREYERKIKEKCRTNTANRAKQLYTHVGGSKTLARRTEEEEDIAEIESMDTSTKELSQNDSLAQVLGKEHPGRVRD
ncbi:hypothetical protein PIB30_061963 [Stylosanthes scabra]|uniref:Uncharacterized protein n=1 Tax=Stylosanthes scabra TaxID=79078 RepID=A0ABU6QKR0_9FABA|nr:hypothetical protein [Stylosanthes scabra]